MEYRIEFDEYNSNLLLFYNQNKLVYFMSLPPRENGCDILLNTNSIPGYNYNVDSIVIITTSSNRTVYYKGKEVATIKRKIHGYE